MDEIEEIKRKKKEAMLRDMAAPAMPSVEYPGSPVTITDATLEASVSQYPLLVVDCWAEWCGPCRSIAPVIEEMAREMKGKVVFGKLNVDQNMQTANRYRISAIPTMLVFKGGQLVDRIIGAYPKQALAKKISKYL